MDAATEVSDRGLQHALNDPVARRARVASDNGELIEIYPCLEADLHLFQQRGLILAGSMRDSDDEHQPILGALRQSDGAAVARLLESHILQAGHAS